MTKLSANVRQICRENYAVNCGRCPLNTECTDRGNATKTFDALDAWRNRLNEAAARYVVERGRLNGD